MMKLPLQLTLDKIQFRPQGLSSHETTLLQFVLLVVGRVIDQMFREVLWTGKIHNSLYFAHSTPNLNAPAPEFDIVSKQSISNE